MSCNLIHKLRLELLVNFSQIELFKISKHSKHLKIKNDEEADIFTFKQRSCY